MEEQVKQKCGFAAMSPEKARDIQSKGGKTAHANGTAHQYTSEEAKAARKIATENMRAKKEKVTP